MPDATDKPQPELPGVIWPADFSAVPLPVKAAKYLGGVIEGRLSGNFTINVRDGEIIGAKFEELIKI
jgi:hypothetical protein